MAKLKVDASFSQGCDAMDHLLIEATIHPNIIVVFPA